jgi:DNA-binding response OmpR family regulator
MANPTERFGLWVLIIDDEAATRTSLRAFLEDNDFNVIEAENGKVGIDVFFREKPDLVFVDLHMSELDGLEVLDVFTKRSPDTPLIAMSGTDNIRDVVDAVRLGAWDYIVKPVKNINDILDAIRRVLRRVEAIRKRRARRIDLEKKVVRKTAELKESRQLADQLALKAEQSDNNGSEFLNTMFHELRTPVHSIITLSQLFNANEQGNLTDKQRNVIQAIQSASLDLLDLVSGYTNPVTMGDKR